MRRQQLPQAPWGLLQKGVRAGGSKANSFSNQVQRMNAEREAVSPGLSWVWAASRGRVSKWCSKIMEVLVQRRPLNRAGGFFWGAPVFAEKWRLSAFAVFDVRLSLISNWSTANTAFGQSRLKHSRTSRLFVMVVSSCSAKRQCTELYWSLVSLSL